MPVNMNWQRGLRQLKKQPKVAFKELDVNSNCYIFPPFQSIVKLRDSVQLFFFIVGDV